MAWMICLLFPGLLLPYAVTEQGLTLRSDRPFDEASARRILARVRHRIDGAPYGRDPFRADVCIPQDPWRWRVCFLPCPRALGLSYPQVRHVFIRPARVDRDRVLSPQGGEVGSYFTLTHLIGHELGHVQMSRAHGRIRTQMGVPEWIREGYAEYVGGIPGFDFDRELQAFLSGDASMQSPMPGVPPYRRLHLLVAYLLEKRGWTMERMLREKPRQDQVEVWMGEGFRRGGFAPLSSASGSA